MEQLGRKYHGKIETACPRCGMVESEWPAGGVAISGTLYCCLGCAESRGCTCPSRRSVLIETMPAVKAGARVESWRPDFKAARTLDD